jgi:hypothetical protein
LVYSEDKAAIIDLSRDTANYGVDLKTKDPISDDDIAKLIPDTLDEDRWELTLEEEQIVHDILVKHPAGGWAVTGASPIQKIKDKAKQAADKAKEGVKKGLDIGKKGYRKVNPEKHGPKQEKDPNAPKVGTLFDELFQNRKAGKDAKNRTKEYLVEERKRLEPLEKAMKKDAGLLKGLELSMQRGFMKPSDLADLGTMIGKDPSLLEVMNLSDLDDPDNAPIKMLYKGFCKMFPNPGAWLKKITVESEALTEQAEKAVRGLGGEFSAIVFSEPVDGSNRVAHITFDYFNQLSKFMQKFKLTRDGDLFVVSKE